MQRSSRFAIALFGITVLGSTEGLNAQTVASTRSTRPSVAAKAAPPLRPMQLSLATAAVASELSVIRLGNVAAGETRSLAITVSALQGHGDTDVRVYCEGESIRCSWRGGERSDRARRASTNPIVELAFAVPQAPGYNYVLVTDGLMRTTNFVVLDYALFAKSSLEIVYTTPGYTSGIGKDWGPWYPVCSGVPLEGYQLAPAQTSFAVSREETGGCGAWVNCEPIPAPTASQVCYRFQVQGKEHQFGRNPHETKKGTATLKVVWQLARSEPTLEPVKPSEAK